MLQNKWFRFFVAVVKTVVVTVLAAAGLTLIGIYLAKYAGVHFPSSIVPGLTIGIAGGVGGHLGNKWKRETTQPP
jgi:hypothetical protein